ncbi:MAG: polyhydroxyalkanoic acid system family protein [Polyangiaceae bacterium]|nr:polyhydroxyalkanoic acid system family protein [Polyangiaceae bacterium]
MSAILIRQKHGLARDEVRARAEGLARRIEQRLRVSWAWQGDEMTLTAPPGPARGATGRVRVAREEVEVEVRLPLALSPMRRLLEGKLREKIDAALGR